MADKSPLVDYESDREDEDLSGAGGNAPNRIDATNKTIKVVAKVVTSKLHSESYR